MANYPDTTTTEFTSDIVLTNGGCAGIGTASPSGSSLKIVEDTASTMPIRIDHTAAAGFSGVQFQSSGSNKAHVGYGNASVGALASKAYFGSIANVATVITSNDTIRITVAAAGNVGINDTNPLHRLSLGGRLHLSDSTNPAAPATGVVLYVDGNGDLAAKNSASVTRIIADF